MEKRTEAVVAHTDGKAKYVLGWLMDGEAPNKLVLVSKPLDRHKDIVDAYRDELAPGQYFQPRGGGYLEINSLERTILAHGQSMDYGPAHRADVQLVLRENYPGYRLL